MSQEQDDKLDALWRRASAEDAGRPAAKTRAAILAEAAAAARRREPAANAPRYWMRMVAGVAVVGIGLVLWRQTDVQLPGEKPVAAPTMQEMARETGGAGAASPVADAVAPVAEAVGESQQARSVPPAVQSAIQMPVARAPDSAALLREHFPTQNASAQAHRLWVVLDASGEVVLTGELAQDARFEDLGPRIRRETGREPTTWRIESLANQQNQRIELGIMQFTR